VSTEGWTQYAEYARRLDSVRAEALARAAGTRKAITEMSTHADELQARLNGQGGMLTKLAATLRLRRPKLLPIVPEGFVEPSTELSHVGQSIDVGDIEARRAADRGQFPALLPNIPPTARSLVVYGLAAALVVLLQALAFIRTGMDTNPFLVLFVIPLIGFVIGFVVLAIGGRTRMTQVALNQRTRLGFLLCFGIGPIASVVVIAFSYKSK
jgi:hypothetical protein